MTKKILSALLLICSLYLHANAQKDSVTISGIVTDFEGNAKDSAFVEIKGRNFGTESMYETYTNSDGRYSLTVKKGKYLALASMKMCEYPKSNSQLLPEDMRLEFWAWNVIAEDDLVLDSLSPLRDLWRYRF
ncbi:carboxypeptidase-like regulatory domain-containing protein [Labilibaculum sp. K2S]|uniref:carboxypeptidase-like regulatory domain-containing protein n=1 Tax=Labilibaculum sp. K2S TaxID=3056386 RepID=UPI0025A4BD82|nr:carboxypeptidase-like regulatory domain-containing protein [Labilibaculum sp. K2S]MDM8160966.1 carboxypeptidase-like regulatory domain-containing protein [Labilibaculum sp. K2S]